MKINKQKILIVLLIIPLCISLAFNFYAWGNYHLTHRGGLIRTLYWSTFFSRGSISGTIIFLETNLENNTLIYNHREQVRRTLCFVASEFESMENRVQEYSNIFSSLYFPESFFNYVPNTLREILHDDIVTESEILFLKLLYEDIITLHYSLTNSLRPISLDPADCRGSWWGCCCSYDINYNLTITQLNTRLKNFNYRWRNFNIE